MEDRPNQKPQTDTAAGDHPQDLVRRLVQRNFLVQSGQLLIGGIPVGDLVDQFGSPLYIYDAAVIEKRIQSVRNVLPENFDLYYSIKANPNQSILKLCLQKGCGLEVASAGELHQALAAGCAPENILFAGPGKTRPELEAAVEAEIGEIHVESIDEARWIDEIATSRNRIVPVALRINPKNASGGAMRMGGQASPFGIDEESLNQFLEQVSPLTSLSVSGVHLFMGTQILDPEVLHAQYHRAIDLAIQVAEYLHRPLQTIDFGGGWGTPYFSRDKALDLSKVANTLRNVNNRIRKHPALQQVRGLLEPGRFLVNESGIYVSRVTRVKQSRDKSFVVVDGGMHHHLAASGNLGQTIKRNYPVAIANRMDDMATDVFQVVGPLCTPLDMLARNVALPDVQPGDLFTVFQSGAYARTASPLGFLSHNPPAEIMVSGGVAKLIRQRGNPQIWLQDQAEVRASTQQNSVDFQNQDPTTQKACDVRQ